MGNVYNAKSEEELNMLSETNVVIDNAVRKLKRVSADEKMRYIYDMSEEVVLEYINR